MAPGAFLFLPEVSFTPFGPSSALFSVIRASALNFSSLIKFRSWSSLPMSSSLLIASADFSMQSVLARRQEFAIVDLRAYCSPSPFISKFGEWRATSFSVPCHRLQQLFFIPGGDRVQNGTLKYHHRNMVFFTHFSFLIESQKAHHAGLPLSNGWVSTC